MTESSSRRRISTNVVTGFLGVGKTTTILNWLNQKPSSERWAILVNEFGDVGIDGAILEGASSNSVAVSEIAGGCICCSSTESIDIALMELIRQGNPDRVLIEPTGIGHPAAILDALRGPWFRDIIDLKATICVVAPMDFERRQVVESPVFRDQLHLADVVVINKSDRSTISQMESAQSYFRDLFPPKLEVLTTTNGIVDVKWLDADTSALRVPLFPNAHPVRRRETAKDHNDSSPSATSILLPGQPVRKESIQSERAACGWIFSPFDRFSRLALMDLLGGSFDVHRLKGVFNVGSEWLLFNRVAGDMTVDSIPYCRDSRIEVILDQPCFDWKDFERSLLSCLKTSI